MYSDAILQDKSGYISVWCFQTLILRVNINANVDINDVVIGRPNRKLRWAFNPKARTAHLMQSRVLSCGLSLVTESISSSLGTQNPPIESKSRSVY